MVPTRTVQRHSSGNGCIFNRVASVTGWLIPLINNTVCRHGENFISKCVIEAHLCAVESWTGCLFPLSHSVSLMCRLCGGPARLMYWKSYTTVVWETHTIYSECCREREFQGWLEGELTAAFWGLLPLVMCQGWASTWAPGHLCDIQPW